MIKDVKIFRRSESERTLKSILQIFIITVIMVSLFSALTVSATKKALIPDTIFANTKAKIDFTDANATGTVKINTVIEFEERIKVTITKNEEDAMTYSYDLKNDKSVEAYPLQMGDGEYIVKVWRNIEGIKYKLKLTAVYVVELEDEFAPFLNPNQYVHFDENSKTVKKAAELTKNCKTDIEKIETIYAYVINNLEYDHHKAATVQDGYIPSADEIIKSGKGICFDYAAVLAVMLRSQGIPTKLVVGYVKDANGGDDLYHAWNKFYLEEGELKIHALKLEDTNLVRVDPTFDSNSNSSKTFYKFISDTENYAKVKKY